MGPESLAFPPDASSASDLDARFHRDPFSKHGAMEQAEQSGAVDGQAKPTAPLRVVAHVEHRAPAPGIGAVEPVDAAAERHDLVEQPERAENR